MRDMPVGDGRNSPVTMQPVNLPRDTRQYLNRLRWRCRRGMRELDVLLLGFLERSYPTVSMAEREAFETLLAMPDPEILDLLAGRLHAQDASLDHVIRRILRAD